MPTNVTHAYVHNTYIRTNICEQHFKRFLHQKRQTKQPTPPTPDIVGHGIVQLRRQSVQQNINNLQHYKVFRNIIFP